MLRRLIAGVSIACLASAVVLAQKSETEDFDGEFKIDKGKFKIVKKIALVDVTGEAKRASREKIGPWTDDGVRMIVDGFRKLGVEVVIGPDVQAAFEQIVPVPTYAELKAAAVKRKGNEQEGERLAQALHNLWTKHEPGEAQKFGYVMYRPDGSVNLERPNVNLEKQRLENPKEKDIRERIATLSQRLGVDSVATLAIGYGDVRWQEPAWQKQAKARGAVIGVVPMIGNIKGLLKGSQATAYFMVQAFDPTGKKQIVEIAGSCKSKKGTGLFNFKDGDELEAMMPSTVSGCVDHIFKKAADKLD